MRGRRGGCGRCLRRHGRRVGDGGGGEDSEAWGAKEDGEEKTSIDAFDGLALVCRTHIRYGSRISRRFCSLIDPRRPAK
jgi:hypothetical protein